MTHEHLKSFIESAYEHAGDISPKTKGVVRDAVEELDLLDKERRAWPRRSTASVAN